MHCTEKSDLVVVMSQIILFAIDYGMYINNCTTNTSERFISKMGLESLVRLSFLPIALRHFLLLMKRPDTLSYGIGTLAIARSQLTLRCLSVNQSTTHDILQLETQNLGLSWLSCGIIILLYIGLGNIIINIRVFKKLTHSLEFIFLTFIIVIQISVSVYKLSIGILSESGIFFCNKFMFCGSNGRIYIFAAISEAMYNGICIVCTSIVYCLVFCGYLRLWL